jgi:hypothetical protein
MPAAHRRRDRIKSYMSFDKAAECPHQYFRKIHVSWPEQFVVVASEKYTEGLRPVVQREGRVHYVLASYSIVPLQRPCAKLGLCSWRTCFGMSVAKMLRAKTGYMLIAVHGHCYGFDCIHRCICDPGASGRVQWLTEGLEIEQIRCFVGLKSRGAVFSGMHVHPI